MAAIGKIRSWGPVLATVIGLALFAFIAEEMFRSCEATSNERRQQVGEVLGKKISVQDFQALVDEYQEVIKTTQGRDNLSEEELNQVKDQVWQQFVNNTILEAEAKKLGLTVTDQEMQNLLKAGTNPMLMQTPFVNQQTGRFEASQLTKFLDDYKKMQSQSQGNTQMMEQYDRIYKYWKFMEKNIRQQLQAEKYQQLLAQCLFSNPYLLRWLSRLRTKRATCSWLLCLTAPSRILRLRFLTLTSRISTTRRRRCSSSMLRAATSSMLTSRL